MFTRSTFPYGAKAACNSSWVVWKLRFPTKMFILGTSPLRFKLSLSDRVGRQGKDTPNVPLAERAARGTAEGGFATLKHPYGIRKNRADADRHRDLRPGPHGFGPGRARNWPGILRFWRATGCICRRFTSLCANGVFPFWTRSSA